MAKQILTYPKVELNLFHVFIQQVFEGYSVLGVVLGVGDTWFPHGSIYLEQ